MIFLLWWSCNPVWPFLLFYALTKSWISKARKNTCKFLSKDICYFQLCFVIISSTSWGSSFPFCQLQLIYFQLLLLKTCISYICPDYMFSVVSTFPLKFSLKCSCWLKDFPLPSQLIEVNIWHFFSLLSQAISSGIFNFLMVYWACFSLRKASIKRKEIISINCKLLSSLTLGR